MQSNNIFADLKEKIGTIRKNNAKTAGKELLTAIEKEETNDARMWLLFSFLLMAASIVTIYMGYKYYFFTFEPSFPGFAIPLSILLSGAVEGGKVFLAYAILSGFIFGWAYRNWSKFLAYVFGAVLAFGTYWWSYTTSTEGISIYAKETSTDNLKGTPLAEYLAAGTVDLTKQIEDINASNEQASNMKTKKGKVNWYGQQALTNNSTTLSNLQQQKAAREAQLTEEWKKGEGRTETRVNKLTEWVMTFGGYAEWCVLFCLLAMIFFDKDRNDAIMSNETAQKVTDKIKAHHAKLSADQMEKELEKAAMMNGSYKDEPLGKM